MTGTALTVGIGALFLAAAPAAQAAPAAATHAASTSVGAQTAAVQASAGPVTVTALKPYFSGKFTVSGKKLMVYPISIKSIKGGVKVHIQQKLMEADPGADETQRGWRTPQGTPLYFFTAGTKTIKTEYRLTNMDWFGNEEVYHVVRFRVESNGVFSPWITVQSPERSVSA
ncbi:hypothetical protein [Arthrobacter globiformis]|uniref:hypothetical protein n=1 Tax=Arthrobacter globiformis TaxID=1665 RepID=UPI00112519E5|nr:hypothetical protein [Arthrobacter globiformis]